MAIPRSRQTLTPGCLFEEGAPLLHCRGSKQNVKSAISTNCEQTGIATTVCRANKDWHLSKVRTVRIILQVANSVVWPLQGKQNK
jgi:hypothetical protein